MSMRLTRIIAPTILALAAGPASAQHHGGGGHGGGVAHGGGAYHGGGAHVGGYHPGNYHSGNYHYGGYQGSYLGGYRGYGYGLGYGGLGLGYGLGYGGLGYGYGSGYGGYGYSYPYSSGYYYPSAGTGYYYPSPAPTPIGNVIPAGGVASPVVPSTSASAAPVTVTILVRDGARVWFNESEDTSAGSSRVFTSSALQPGQVSALGVRVTQDGNTRWMNLPLRTGENMTVDLR